MKDMENNWIDIEKELPPNGVLVETKIEDYKGVRNECKLIRRNFLWFTEDSSMYVYFTPTHWRPKT